MTMQFCAVRTNFSRRQSRLARSCCSSFPGIFLQFPGGPVIATASFRRASIATLVALYLALMMPSARAATAQLIGAKLSPVCTPFAKFITADAAQFNIQAAWICAVIGSESAGDVHAISPKGAIGLMQLMPQTWVSFRRLYHLGDDPESPRDNIFAGTAYLRALLDRYGASGFLAAYNAGPARWEAHVATGAKLPAETKAYLARLLPIIDGDDAGADLAVTSTQSWSTAPLFPAFFFTPPIGSANAPAIERKIGEKTAFAPHGNGLFVTASGQRLGP